MTSTNSPNKSAPETTALQQGAVGVGALDDAARRKKVDDDNTFLRNQVATMSNALEILLARTPQTTQAIPNCLRTKGVCTQTHGVWR